MFWRKILTSPTKLYKTQLPGWVLRHQHVNYNSFHGVPVKSRNLFGDNIQKNRSILLVRLKALTSHHNNVGLKAYCTSKELVNDDISQQNQKEKELQRINELFPDPRVTLKELSDRIPDKVFEIHYKQNMSAPKVSRKKQKPQNNDWTCTYSFVWPEKIKFEGTALSKRQAAEKAAIQALHYLHINNRINSKGHPVYDRNKIHEIRSTIQEPIKINISDKSMERVDKIWEQYENDIKSVYERTFKEAKHKVIAPYPILNRDSTIDEEDEVSIDATKSSRLEAEDLSELKVQVHPVYCRSIDPPTEATLQRRDRLLQQKFERYDEELMPLPIDQYTEEITSTLSKSRVAVLVGAAGCGKSTRAPACVLRASRARAHVIVSQPRRVAAIGLAQRVAHELHEQVGETVGYQIRLQAKPPRPPAGGILYCTSGILLRRLQANPGLIGCTHVFIDEAHERDVNTDITLLLLKRALDINPNLHVIVMSATLDIGVFTKYFDSCPVIEVPGRTFPVEVSHLEDIQEKFNLRLPATLENCQREDGKPQINCQEMVQVIKAIDSNEPEGAILVFLPGWGDIAYTKQLLEQIYPESTHTIVPVHSRLSTEDQSKIFSKPPPGVRKIVLATNIAETSITIPDAVCVVDSGAHKENTLTHDTGVASLETVWVSKAGAAQRAGRAGRVRPGHCYRLYTKQKESELSPHSTPEILRVPLDQTVLDCKTYAPDDKVENFLSQLPEPPTKQAIQFAVSELIDLGALTPREQLTRVGHILCSLPLAPRLARALLHGALAGCALSSANTLTHCQQQHHLFTLPPQHSKEEIRDIKRRYSETSDHVALHWIQDEFEQQLDELGWREIDAWCDKNKLRKDRLAYVKSLSNLYLENVLKCGVFEASITPEELNRFSEIDEITVAVLLSGTNSLLRSKKTVRTKGKLQAVNELFTSKGDRAHIGSESVNYNITKRTTNSLLTYFGGYHSTERRALVTHMTSVIPPHTALLFAMGDVTKEVLNEGSEDSTAILTLKKHKLQVQMSLSQAEHILKAREMLWNTFQYYIDRDLKTLDYEENGTISRFKVRLVKAIGRILVEGHREYVLNKKIDEFDDVDR